MNVVLFAVICGAAGALIAKAHSIVFLQGAVFGADAVKAQIKARVVE